MAPAGWQAHGPLAGRLAEEAFARAQHDREEHQADLVDQIMLKQRAHQLVAGVNDDVPGHLLLQLTDLGRHVARQHGRVGPRGLGPARGYHVLGQAVQPVGPLAGPGRPAGGEPFVAATAKQQGLRAPRLLE